MATSPRAVVSKRSETWEGAAGRTWHLGQEEGAGKQAWVEARGTCTGWGEEVRTALEGQGQEGMKEGRTGRCSCIRQSTLACRAWLETQQPHPAAPTCRELGRSGPLSSLLAPGRLAAAAAAGAPCTHGCPVAHRVFTQVLFQETRPKPTTLPHSRECLGGRIGQGERIAGQLD